MGVDIKAILKKVGLPIAGLAGVGIVGRHLRKKGHKKITESSR